MKEVNTTPGKTYAVTSPNSCTVTTEDGLTLAEIEAGKQGYFVAVGGKVQLSDDSAILTQLFKLAPQQRLALLGVLGGNGGLPAGFKRVEYLQSSGSQYIDTGFLSREFLNSELEVLTGLPPSSNEAYNGSFHSGGLSLQFWLAQNTKQVGGVFFSSVACNATANDFSGYFKINLRENFVSVNSEQIKTNAPLSSVSEIEKTNDKFLLFARSSYPNSVNCCAVRIKYFKCQKNGKETMSLIPCLDDTGAPCMYDLVSKKAFYNRGTGDFLYPTESSTYSLRRVLPDWGKLTENGLRRLYHAPANYQGELIDYALDNGYKPIIEPEKPETGYWSPRWMETEEEIVLEWVETEPPSDDFGMPDEPLTETE